jgi:hypothetical protein
MDLQKRLPLLVPKAIAWAQKQSHLILRSGVSLNEKGTALATRVGVTKPELVRIQYVSELPMPEDPLLREVADATGLIGSDTAGITVGYGIFIVEKCADVRLISHELRHVQQYESLGGIEAFMPVYLAQIASVGYHDAPLEQDARAYEVNAV